MKRLKNIFKIAVLSLAIVFSFSAFGCARVQPCTMEELKGTYKLKNYSRSYYKLNEQNERVLDRDEDFLKTKNIEMFLIITGDEFGYIAYKDNDTSLIVREVRLAYNYEYEVVDGQTVYTDKISTIEYRTLSGRNYENINDSWANLGTTNKGQKLNNTHPAYEHGLTNLLYRDYVDFEKVSKDVDLKYIREKYTALPQIEPYQNI